MFKIMRSPHYTQLDLDKIASELKAWAEKTGIDGNVASLEEFIQNRDRMFFIMRDQVLEVLKPLSVKEYEKWGVDYYEEVGIIGKKTGIFR